MALYVFEDANGTRRTLKAPMSRAPELARRMVRLGWRRLYTLPNVVIYPSYSEAMEESAQEAARLDRDGGWSGLADA